MKHFAKNFDTFKKIHDKKNKRKKQQKHNNNCCRK